MNYWERRQQQLNSQLEKDEAKLKKRLSSFYDSEYRKLEKEIASYYQKYGENNVIQYRKLMGSLPEEDKRLLIERMEEFADKYPQYEDMLPVRESIYKLNRLEGLQMSIRLQQIEIGAVDNTKLQEHLEKQAVRGANAAAETLGFGKNFYGVDSAVVKSVVNMAWANGENFSISIWKNTNKLANYLCTDIAQAIARGDSYDKVAKNMKKRFGDVSRNDMYRLIYTEGTYVMAESTMQPFTEDFEKYQISTVGDGKVCSICSGVAHEIFEIKDRKPGVNFPPFHPWCRCTFIIVVDDWDKWMDGYEKKHGNGQARTAYNRLNAITEPFGRHVRFKTGGMNPKEYALLKSSDSKYYETIQLSKSEYAMVIHALNTDLTDEQRTHKIIHKSIGNYIYTVENNGYDNYRIIGREEISESVTELFERNI